MKLLYVICGIPASGKSTVAAEIAVREGAAILSADSIRKELFPGEGYDPLQNDAVYQRLRELVTMAFSKGRPFIIDAANNRPSERRALAARARRKGYRSICVFCTKHYTYALRANRQRKAEERVPDGVIINRYFGLLPPSLDEGWNEIRIVDGDAYSRKVEGQPPVQ